MKNIFIMFILIFGVAALNAQNTEPTEAEKILKDLYGNKETATTASTATASSSTVENNSVFRDWLLASLEGWLMILTEESNSSFRRSKDVQYLPAIWVGRSIVSITSLIDEMDLEIKKDKIKVPFIAINYLTGKEKKLSSMKIVDDVFYKAVGDKSNISKAEFDPSANSIFIYFKEDTYHSIAFAKEEKIEENMSRIPDDSSGFLIQRNLDSEDQDYALVGVYGGNSGQMIFFESSTIENIKKI